MIMTNSNMNTISGMAGGGLVVSSSANKPLTNASNMMAPGQQHLPGSHAVGQVSFLFFLVLFYLEIAEPNYIIMLFTLNPINAYNTVISHVRATVYHLEFPIIWMKMILDYLRINSSIRKTHFQLPSLVANSFLCFEYSFANISSSVPK